MKKIIVWSISVLALLAIMAGGWKWNQQVEETAADAKESLEMPASKKNNSNKPGIPNEQAEAENEEEDETDKSSKSSDKETSSSHSDSETKQGGKKENGQKSADNKKSNESNELETGSAGNSSDHGTAKPNKKNKSLAEIKTYYNSLFTELEAQETSKIDQLVVEAKAEIISKKKPASELIGKYQSYAGLMERNADSTFNTLYQQLQFDLESNGYSLNEAQEYQQTYNAKKQERKSRVISQLKNL
ncbi:hypothetical protein ABE29_18445 [Cytobacillus firmus]|uniref:hypothetical protein n=1 Tax=Cytobacillus firmus TaxID=1399 RepID=UPI00077C9273|nr:hypothetical protein [Cytobacillus firmus]MBG9544671.1 hypothetical protein [Cytobacillus firmus]MBG9553665.1 hypothetical protein [Cytobacillus firmus]MBG9558419.1 hypothetical protein [Cytobacillus firmus]MBG9577039.1 hypothetical protein [Cytobacillus firmus]MEC1894298.1 hypothetical protein [Cytobacillus firmus]